MVYVLLRTGKTIEQFPSGTHVAFPLPDMTTMRTQHLFPSKKGGMVTKGELCLEALYKPQGDANKPQGYANKPEATLINHKTAPKNRIWSGYA